MTTDQETLNAIGVWLEEGRTALPEHVLDAVLEELPRNPQRRPTWTARRIANMHGLAKYAMAAAAVVVVAIVGYNLLAAPGTSQVGSAQPTISASPAPSPSPSSTVVRLVPTSGVIEPGRYRWVASGGDASLVIPDGWTGLPDGSIAKNPETPADITLGHSLPGTQWAVTHVYTDACDSENALEPIGPTVDDLIGALQAQEGVDVVVGEVTAGSVVGQRIAIEQDAGLADRSACRFGDGGPLQIWADAAETGFFALKPGFRGLVYVFEVEGDRLVFVTTYGPEASPADLAEVDAIVESMEFTTR